MRRIVTLALLLGTGIVAIARTPPAAPPPAMAAAARAFLDSLTPELKARAQFPFDADERFVWFYTPVPRKGLTLKDMTEPQRTAAMNLLRTGLSEKGYSKAETIRSLEDVLVELGGNPVQRDRQLYYFSIFGEPSPKATWGWRYEGHHLSQNWTIVNGIALATTPQFFGANPAEVRQGSRTGLRALAAEEDLGYELLRSLDGSQRQSAVIDPKSPNDILTTNTREAAIQEDRGLPYAQMTAAQRAILVKIIEEHAGAQAEPVAKERLAKAKDALNQIKFAWMGGAEKGEGHYYRVQGPAFIIEFDNTQNNANHIHQVWRDYKGDWGRDLLAEHYKAAAHKP
ncbi:MAG: DUF3500 domain-containing protein [Acidobacteriota bacterium]|nr:DUF3500 domain-containing protein [Acidobacteriota bacterium]